ncbi:MAG TPA: Rieske 2Fe-2S domain-containing protein [Ktedonobacteraceae bacterium]|nr:Rieske 2Fe-2S domain-containing protein [Ktedonobacteraceae bacterium]
MSGENGQDQDKERFEDYLELEQYIEQLQAGRVAHPPAELTPGQARIYRMAALFRSASPDAAEPRPEFASELQARLEKELRQPAKPRPFALLRRKPKGADNGTQVKPQRGVSLSRRALITGSAAVAASLVVGAAVEHAVEQNHAPQASIPSIQPSATGSIIGDHIPTKWIAVIPLADLGNGAVRFVSDAVVAYVIRDDGDDGDPDKGKIIAMSAACTHMGCIVQWQNSDRKYHCPCHGGLFTEYGHVDNITGSWGVRYLTPLPRLNTKVEDGFVKVEVPVVNL